MSFTNLDGRVVEQALSGTFATNAFSQGGGWVDGFSGIAVTLNLTNADFHRVQSMRYTDDGEPIYPTDTISAAGCQRPLDATNTLCSYTGFSNVQTFTNTATGKAWTPVDMFISAVSNSAAYPPRQNFTDVSGMARWPQDPFVQNLQQNYTALPSPALDTYAVANLDWRATQRDRPARTALHPATLSRFANMDFARHELESDLAQMFLLTRRQPISRLNSIAFPRRSSLF